MLDAGADSDTDDAEARNDPPVAVPKPNSVPENNSASASSADSVSICVSLGKSSGCVKYAGNIRWFRFCSRANSLLVSVTVIVGIELEDEVVVRTDEVVLDLPRPPERLLFAPSTSCASRSTCA